MFIIVKSGGGPVVSVYFARLFQSLVCESSVVIYEEVLGAGRKL